VNVDEARTSIVSTVSIGDAHAGDWCGVE